MRYMLIFTEDQTAFDIRNDPEKAGPYWGAWTAYAGAVHQAGIVVSGEGLQPPHAATQIRIRDGKRHVQDGPFADAKEHVGGFFVIDVPDLDTALDWAAKSPAASYGTVEVRPTLPPPPMPG